MMDSQNRISISAYLSQKVLRISLLMFTVLVFVIIISTWIIETHSASKRLKDSASSVANIYRTHILSNEIKFTERSIKESLKLSDEETIKILDRDRDPIYESATDIEIKVNNSLKSCKFGRVCLKYQHIFIYEPIYFDDQNDQLFGYIYLERNLVWNWRFILATSLFFGFLLLLQLFGIQKAVIASSKHLSKAVHEWASHLRQNPKNASDLSSSPFLELDPLFEAMKSLNQQIERYEYQANQDGRELVLRGIAHDLINPISQMKLFLASIENKPLSIDVRDTVLDLKTSLSRLSLIASQVKSIRNEESPPELFDLKECLHEEIQILESHPISKSRALNFEVIGSSHLYASISKADFIRIIQNIGLNAIESSNQNTTIQFIVFSSQKNVVLAISDQGKGVSSEALRNIFREGFTSKSTLGSGLGLSIVKHICHKRGGSVSFRSIENQGSTVTIQLPLYEGDSSNREVNHVI